MLSLSFSRVCRVVLLRCACQVSVGNGCGCCFPFAQAPAGSDEDSEDDSLFGEGDEDSDSSESEGEGRAELKGRAKWLKKTTDTAVQGARDVKRELKKSVGPKVKEYASWAPSGPKRSAAFQLEEKMTEEELDRKVAELLASRGKKNTDAREVLRQLEVLTKAARVHGARKEIPVLMHLISAMFDSQRSIDDFMELLQWRTAHRSLARIVGLLDSHRKLVLGTVGSDEVSEVLVGAHMRAVKEEAVEEDGAEASKSDPNRLKVVGSVESFVLRLADEYTKALQQINPHTKVRIRRLSTCVWCCCYASLFCSLHRTACASVCDSSRACRRPKAVWGVYYVGDVNPDSEERVC